MKKLSVVIITKNEEKNIRRCLDSVSWADEIVLIDSQSEDNTRAIAEEFGAKIYSPEWKGYGHAKQEGVKHCSHNWILSIDADEVITEELKSEIQLVLSVENPKDGYLIPRKTNFMGRWINHSNWYPDFVLRLFNKEKGGFNDNYVHEAVEIGGPKDYLNHDMLHYSYPDLGEYFRKFNIYTTMGAEELARRGKGAGFFAIFIKPVASFIKHYFIKRGFLDGLEGFVVSFLSSIAVFVKYCKLREINKKSESVK